MTHHKISKLSRVLLILCAAGLLAVLFTPIWRIDLEAPQYPEGLSMFIYANKLSGDIEIINGLNHYIGMKKLHSEDFKEFKVLSGIVVFFAALFVGVAVSGRRRWLKILLVLFVAFGVLAMVDFWKWEYAYGHNLNPNAPIIVPGMAYQPPLVGFKQLLNFGAYSMPAIGGWIFVVVGMLLMGSVMYEWKKARDRIIVAPVLKTLAVLFIGASMLTGCSSGPQAIKVGTDDCAFCKMKISDNRFGAEIVTTKGKVYKFDDAHCILSFIKSAAVPKKDLGTIYFTTFNAPHDLLKVDQVSFLQSPSFKSPMNGNIAAFSSEEQLVSVLPEFKGSRITWEEMLK